MAENATKMCRICLTTNSDTNITDSSCYNTFFTQIMCVYEFKGQLWLCMWCKTSLKRTMSLLALALESEQIQQDKIVTDIIPKSLYKLDYTHNTHTDIPPLLLSEYHGDELIIKAEKNTVKPEKTTNILQKRVANPLNSNKINPKYTDCKIINEISNLKNEAFENRKTLKRNKKKEFIFNELNFDVEYLSLEEQLKEIEIKRLKYKDFKFQCLQCGMGFVTSDVCDEHKIRHSELSGPHKCHICSLHFKSPDVLSQHMLAHKRRFKCLFCTTVFKRWSHCTAHRYKCGGLVQPTACKECSKIFSDEHSLKVHMKVHKTEKKYCCDLCDKKFGSKQRLTVHMRSHSGDKPFSCLDCNRSFSTSSNLRAHRTVHVTTSQYYCVECHTYYKTAKSLKRHFNESARHMSRNTVMHTCNVCSKQFSTENSLKSHVTTRHGKEYRCTHCDKTFSNNSNLNKHIKCIHAAK